VHCTTSFPPPLLASAAKFQIRYAHQLYIVIVANGCGYTQGPFWLPWRIALVGQENQTEDVRFFLFPLTTPPVVAAKTRVQRCLCREVDGIWQYRTGGNLTIFDKDHDIAEEGRSQVRQKQSSCSQAYGDLASPRTEAKYTFFSRGGKLVVQRTVVKLEKIKKRSFYIQIRLNFIMLNFEVYLFKLILY